MKILYVVHSFPPVENTGTPLIAKQYAALASKKGHEVAIGLPLSSEKLNLCKVENASAATFFELPKSEGYWALDESDLTDHDSLSTESEILDFDPDVIHIIDWVFCSKKVWKIFKRKDCPIIRHIWNFEDVCARISPCFKRDLMLPCLPLLSAKDCADCVVDNIAVALPKMAKVGAVLKAINRYRDEKGVKVRAQVERKWGSLGTLDNLTDLLIFPANTFHDFYRAHRPNLKTPSVTISHGVSTVKKDLHSNPRFGGKIRFLFLGQAEARKGWPLVETTFAELSKTHSGLFSLIAYGLDPDQISHSPLKDLSEVELYPPYKYSQLSFILTKADVGLVPSAFETFNRVCREMLASGMPVIGSNAFGIPDVVKHGVNGLILNSLTSTDLKEIVIGLLYSQETLARITIGALSTQIKTPEEEFEEIELAYEALRQADRTFPISTP
jgi:glycosyltransferase involved in cell wall biosynthesis